MDLFLLGIIIISLALIIYFSGKHMLNDAQICKLKYTLYALVVMMASVFTMPIFLLHPRSVRNIRVAGIMLNPLFSLFGFKYRIENGEVFDRVQGCVIVGNHQSSIDFIGMMKLWPEYIRYCTILAKKELIYALPFGFSAWLAGVEFVDRKNRERAKETIAQLTKKVQEKSLRLWVFPEGTRNMSDTLLPFKYGAFRLAIQAQIPVIPIVFSNYHSIYNADQKTHSFYWHSGCITIKCLEPIETKGMTIEKDLQRLTDITRQRMIHTFQAIQTTQF